MKSEKAVILLYYSYDKIDELKADYNIIIGQRSNGKTYGILKKIIDAFNDTGKPSAYIRRLDEMIKPANLQSLFNPFRSYIYKMTEGRYNGFTYRSHEFKMCFYDETNHIIEKSETFCRTYAISTAESTKGQDAGEVALVVFDEFMTRQNYLQNEFIKFTNILSSILRDRYGSPIYLLGNTVNKHCPYFKEMGLTRISKQQQGTIDIYKMGDSATTIAVEYCADVAQEKKINRYFCFDSPKLNMIRSGTWEIDNYRHPPKGLCKYDPEFIFLIVFDSNIIQGDIYIYNDYPIIVLHEKTTEIKNEEETIIYTDEDVEDGNILHQNDLIVRPTRAHELIARLFQSKKTFYSNNEVGEIVANWYKAHGLQKSRTI